MPMVIRTLVYRGDAADLVRLLALSLPDGPSRYNGKSSNAPTLVLNTTFSDIPTENFGSQRETDLQYYTTLCSALRALRAALPAEAQA